MISRCGGRGGDAAEPDFLQRKGVGGAEDGAHVVQAAHVVEHQYHRAFGRTFEVSHRHPVQLGHRQFSHAQRYFGAVPSARQERAVARSMFATAAGNAG